MFGLRLWHGLQNHPRRYADHAAAFDDTTDGKAPFAGLVQGTNGNFYGTTFQGGTAGIGTVFRITPTGARTKVRSFVPATGGAPYAGLVQASGGNFYGTTYGGGAAGLGTICEITPNGTITILHSFNGTDGANPMAALVQATDGNFYGTTEFGANNACFGGCGTVFKLTPSGTLTTLHSFKATDGNYPFAGLIQAADGDFYGTTEHGGPHGLGTVFKITAGGALTTLHNFDGTGSRPYAGLVQGTDGNFYGTTATGGAGDCANGCGTVFNITPSGTLTTLHRFHGTDGGFPSGTLIQATDGKFYGTTEYGGAGTCTSLPGCGTVFSLDVGLGQSVLTQPAFGTVGAAVDILGTNLNGATSVTFNGTAATFTVVSHALITTTVPAGATSGTVQVANPTGTVSSNVPFTVK